MFVETIEALSTGIGVIEVSEKVFPTFKKVFRKITKGDLTIAIFGAGGTGKSTLGKTLSGTLEIGGFLQKYNESIFEEKYKLDSNIIGSVIVAPGQKRREDSWGDLLRLLSKGKIKLVINVVSYGYHSFGEFSYTQHRLFKDGMNVEEFMEEYAKDCRQRELEVLEKITPHLSITNQKKTILITLITKQDLWWNERLNVKDYYENGEYSQLIKKIQDKLGSANFVHEYRSTSLVIQNLLSGTGELLIPTTAGYDQILQVANLNFFFNAIETLFNISLKNIKGG